ncbi:MAG: helix-turn-helix transcriptional regulator [Clostridia bacterium]|nr:helix-turn-helix transcriptional regulator [Clostridia bacterium]
MAFELKRIKREIEIEGFHSIYYFEFDKYFSHVPEKHDFWEMIYIDSGEIDAITNGLGETVSQGQVLFHKPNELHAHISNGKVSNNMLVISFTSKSPAMYFFDRKLFTLDKTQKTLLTLFMKEAKIALGKISGEYSNKNPIDFTKAPFGSTQLLECYFVEFLLTLERSNADSVVKVTRTESTLEQGQSSIAELMIDYMKAHICENVTLMDLCQKFYMGKTQLCTIFGNYVGISPIEYFLDLKFKEAKRLLREEKFSISKISDTLGYSSIHAFSRSFKNSTGVSPSEYRKRLNRE